MQNSYLGEDRKNNLMTLANVVLEPKIKNKILSLKILPTLMRYSIKADKACFFKVQLALLASKITTAHTVKFGHLVFIFTRKSYLNDRFSMVK